MPVRDILHDTFLCSAPTRHRGGTLSAQRHVPLILEHAKLTIRDLTRALCDAKRLCVFAGVAPLRPIQPPADMACGVGEFSTLSTHGPCGIFIDRPPRTTSNHHLIWTTRSWNCARWGNLTSYLVTVLVLDTRHLCSRVGPLLR